MRRKLPATGTQQLLDLISPYVPDELINELWPMQATGGRRHDWSSPQLWRVHLLAFLTPTHSFNLLSRQLREQAGWRSFCCLRKSQLPGSRALSEFRARMGVAGLPRVLRHLLGQLFSAHGCQQHAVAIIDATDLPATCRTFKKTNPKDTAPRGPAPMLEHSSPDRAATSLDTRNTPCDCGCPIRKTR